MIEAPWDAIYLRKSRDKADMADPDLLHKHRREMLRLAAARGATIPPERIYEEQGSGERLRTRPVCRRLMEDMARLPRSAGGRLWTTEVSRLTRGSLSDRARVYEVMERAAILHCTRDRDYDLRKASDLYYWETETAQASRELGIYKERVEAARLDMVAEGKIPTGSPPYGWWWDRNAKNLDGSRGATRTHPEQFPVVQALCRDALMLSTYRLEARYGLPQPIIYNLLTNPFICGWPARRHFPHGGERRRRDSGEPWKYPSHRLPRAEWIWPQQPGDYEPACTRAEWDAIQAVLGQRRLSRAHTDTADGWCRDVVRFEGHEETGVRLSAKGDGRWHHLTYELSSLPRGSHRTYIRRDTVHDAASAAIVALLADPGRLRAGIGAYLGSRRGSAPAPDTAALEAEAARLERRIDALLDRELDAAERRDAEDLASVQRQRDDYKRQLGAARAQIAALASGRAPDSGIDGLIAWLPEIGGDVAAAVWERIDDAGRRVVVRGLVEVILCRVARDSGDPRRPYTRTVQAVRLKEPWRK